jgi:hypothetical protein
LQHFRKYLLATKPKTIGKEVYIKRHFQCPKNDKIQHVPNNYDSKWTGKLTTNPLWD